MLFAPTGVPDELMEKINIDVNEVLRMPDVVQQFASRGGNTVQSSRLEAHNFFMSEMAKWKEVTAKNKIRMG